MIEKLKQMVEVIAWLDSGRWSEENQNASTLWEPVSSLSPSESILVHWLTYITDIQRPWQYVWRVGEKVFVEIVRAFSKHEFYASENVDQTQQEVVKLIDTYRGKQEPKKVRPFRFEKIEYRPRFPNQHIFIDRTLTILAHSFNRDFMKFVGESIKRHNGKDNGLKNVALDLYFLTYSDCPMEETLRFFENSMPYPALDNFGHKRLWAALRDYRKSKKYLQLFRDGLKDAMGQDAGEQLFRMWMAKEAFSLHLLELPGDVWNIQFLQRAVIPLAERCNINIKKAWSPSRIAREIYDAIGSQAFYPEQLDVSWDLSAKACENELCDLCPFGECDLQKICLKDLSVAKDKYCPIVLATCQYRLICNPEKCPISNGKGIGLCTEIT